MRRFEQTGEISFVSLLNIAAVLGELNQFAELFISREYTSIQEVIDERKRLAVKYQGRVVGTLAETNTGYILTNDRRQMGDLLEVGKATGLYKRVKFNMDVTSLACMFAL